ncbi:DUF3152 domain-containing protein [Streptomyces sp. MBT49]|nr:DUF3152 domain-containing protein [Streptomyces sp. MBT49]
MGRHSRRGPAPKGAAKGGPRGSAAEPPAPGDPRGGRPPAPPRERDEYDGTPSHGVPRFPVSEGTPAHGFPQVRGGHPEQREGGGGWGDLRGRSAGTGQPVIPRQRTMPQGGPRQGPRPGPRQGPRQEYLDAFGEEDEDVFTRARTPYAATRVRDSRFPRTADREDVTPATAPAGTGGDASPSGGSTAAPGVRGRAFGGIAAAAVTTVLAVVVAGQVATGRDDDSGRSRSTASGQTREAVDDGAARGGDRPSPSVSAGAGGGAVTLTYAQRMQAKYPLSPKFKGSGKFDAVAGIAKAPGKGRKYTYRVDVEQGLGLDGELFAQAVQKTLNDGRSWAHGGARTFERIQSGKADFVITLASPATTAVWCAKSGLDTTQDNVSCDSASTERVMINAYRWAQGSVTFGNQMYAYRQMLINHEVGHRLGFGHVTCDKDGELAPVMQQQTKFLDHDGIHCLPNAWPYPNS